MPIKFPATIELKMNSEPEKFQFNFKVCKNPDCNCNGVNMVLYNEKKEVHFFLDFSVESYLMDNHSEDETRIIKAFIDFLKSEENHSLNLEFFKKDYDHVKAKANGRKDAIDSFNLGTFLNYREIIWHEDDIKIKINDKKYIIFDAYCVTPNCTCRDVALNFFEDIYKLGSRNADFAFVYNYITRVYRDPKGINDLQVENIIKMIPDSMENKFKKRHTKLKNEIKKDILRKIEEEGFVYNETGKRKLGRNELCHCGSGKKYKKCCLNNDVKKYGNAIKVEY